VKVPTKSAISEVSAFTQSYVPVRHIQHHKGATKSAVPLSRLQPGADTPQFQLQGPEYTDSAKQPTLSDDAICAKPRTKEYNNMNPNSLPLAHEYHCIIVSIGNAIQGP
jgi:hypothetical protein